MLESVSRYLGRPLSERVTRRCCAAKTNGRAASRGLGFPLLAVASVDYADWPARGRSRFGSRMVTMPINGRNAHTW